MNGLVLCGGQSTRMGTDKGLLLAGGKTWAQLVAEKLQATGLPAYFSVNSMQYRPYQQQFPNLVEDNETIAVKGPLLGLLSAHLFLPGADWLVLACDMLTMNIAMLQKLKDFYTQTTADAFVFTNEERYEPLCGIYTAKSLAHLYQLSQKKQLERYSMKYALAQLSVASLPIAADETVYFQNFNTTLK